jgi:hypothetical protein
VLFFEQRSDLRPEPSLNLDQLFRYDFKKNQELLDLRIFNIKLQSERAYFGFQSHFDLVEFCQSLLKIARGLFLVFN